MHGSGEEKGREDAWVRCERRDARTWGRASEAKGRGDARSEGGVRMRPKRREEEDPVGAVRMKRGGQPAGAGSSES
jgi:hypothetical protein